MTPHTSCKCCTGGDDGDDRTRWLRTTIAEVGWAVVAVAADPAHAFTVGLWHSFDLPELAMFGLQPTDMQVWLNECVRLLRRRGPAAAADGETIDGVLSGYALMLSEVHPTWREPLFGAVCSYYGTTEVPVRQVVWPDRDGRWPWDEAASEACRLGQPQAWLPVADHPEGGWRLVGELALDWPFTGLQPDTMVMAPKDVVEGRRPIVAVAHDKDGGWDFIDDRGYVDEVINWVHFGILYRNQPWLGRFADLPPDTQAWLDEDGQWRSRPFSGDPD
jgi:hypothetical protein